MVTTLPSRLIRAPVLACTVSVPTGAAPVTHQDQGLGRQLSRKEKGARLDLFDSPNKSMQPTRYARG